MKWDTWSSKILPVCDKLEQIKNFEAEYFKLGGFVQADYVDKCSCPLPCRYKEYQIIGEPIDGKPNQLQLAFVFANWEVTEAVEEHIYSFESFVSEFGGSLGLFLGFSFYMLLDPFILFMDFVKKSLAPRNYYQ